MYEKLGKLGKAPHDDPFHLFYKQNEKNNKIKKVDLVNKKCYKISNKFEKENFFL